MLKRINVDEIVKEFGDWKNKQDVIKASKMALLNLNEAFSKNESVNQETTLCGKSIIKNINKAKENHYFVELYFVGLKSYDLAIKRVKMRVKAGGHDIEDEDIKRRFYESLINLKKIIKICDKVEIYDNTLKLTKIAIYKNGKEVYLSQELPKWFCDYVLAQDL